MIPRDVTAKVPDAKQEATDPPDSKNSLTRNHPRANKRYKGTQTDRAPKDEQVELAKQKAKIKRQKAKGKIQKQFQGW